MGFDDAQIGLHTSVLGSGYTSGLASYGLVPPFDPPAGLPSGSLWISLRTIAPLRPDSTSKNPVLSTAVDSIELGFLFRMQHHPGLKSSYHSTSRETKPSTKADGPQPIHAPPTSARSRLPRSNIRADGNRLTTPSANYLPLLMRRHSNPPLIS